MERSERGRTVDRRSLDLREGREREERRERGSTGLWQSIALQSHNYLVFLRCDSVCFRKCECFSKSYFCFVTAFTVSRKCLHECEPYQSRKEKKVCLCRSVVILYSRGNKCVELVVLVAGPLTKCSLSKPHRPLEL